MSYNRDNNENIEAMQFNRGRNPSSQRMPPSPPPNFTPEMPRGVGEGVAPRGFQGRPGRPGFNAGCLNCQTGLRRCINRFTFIWTFNSGGFWFFPTFVGRQFAEGFRWTGNRWVFDRIFIGRIIFFRCF